MAIQTRTNKDGITVYSAIDKVTLKVDGKSKRKSIHLGTFSTEKLARKAIGEHRARQQLIADGELPAAIDPRRTLGQAIDAFLDHLATLSIDDHGGRSHDHYETRLRCHVDDEMRRVPLAKLDKDRIVAWRKALRRVDGEPMAPASVNAIMVALTACLTYAVEQDFIAKNPAHGIKNLRVKNPQSPTSGYLWIRDLADVPRLLANCGSESTRTIVATLLGTGLRLDECLHLRASDVDLDQRLIHVQRGRKGPTKSGRDRHVPIGDSVLPVLAARVKLAGKGGLLWPGEARDERGRAKPLVKVTVWRAFKGALTRAGMDNEMSPHDLRHTFATHYLINGGDIFRLSRILGHASVTETEKTYAHYDPRKHTDDYGRVSFALVA
jgi:integrase